MTGDKQPKMLVENTIISTHYCVNAHNYVVVGLLVNLSNPCQFKTSILFQKSFDENCSCWVQGHFKVIQGQIIKIP